MQLNQILWIVALTLILFLTIKISLHINDTKERFTREVQDLFTMQEQWYLDLFTSIFLPFDWKEYITGQDDDSEKQLLVWSTDPQKYGVYVAFDDSIDCNSLSAPFMLARYQRMFLNDKNGCIIVIDKNKLNRPDLIFFMNSITPSLNRTNNVMAESVETENKIVYSSKNLSGKVIYLKLEKPSLISHYYLSCEKGPLPSKWALYGLKNNGRKELINHYAYTWRANGQRLRFECFSGKPYHKYLFEFDTELVSVSIEATGRFVIGS